MLSIHTASMQVYEAQCPQCRKIKTIHVINGKVGNKDFESVQCNCGSLISIDVLKYLFRISENIESDLEYFVY